MDPVIVQLLLSAEDVGDWKGRCQVFWGQYFFQRRGISPNERGALFTKLVPTHLRSYEVELAGYFDQAHQQMLEFLRKRIDAYGTMFLENSEAGKEWLSARQAAKKHHDKNPSGPMCLEDILEFHGKKGITFECYHVIDFYLRMLVVVETEELSPRSEGIHIGWLADDNDDAWYQRLRKNALGLILIYAQNEGARRNSYLGRAMSKDLMSTPTLSTKWPPPIKADDYRIFGNANRKLPTPLVDYEHDEESSTVADDRPDKELKIEYELEEDDKLFELCDQFAKSAEQEYRERAKKISKEAMEAKLYAEKGEGGDEVVSLDYFSSMTQTAPQPQWYATRVSNYYVKANYFRKMALHRQLCMQYKAALESELLVTSARIEQVNADIEHFDKVAEGIAAREKKLAEMLGQEEMARSKLEDKAGIMGMPLPLGGYGRAGQMPNYPYAMQPGPPYYGGNYGMYGFGGGGQMCPLMNMFPMGRGEHVGPPQTSLRAGGSMGSMMSSPASGLGGPGVASGALSSSPNPSLGWEDV
ncbi:hypothetical protein BDZ91DRAFT_501964 [Kalaharituber pfeilii]|nr:hypothetical protein BDZ91DRAFT_501964 [Kalaharituber pfeilii]